MCGDTLHRRPAGTHEARVVGPEEVEVGPEGYGLQLQSAQGSGERPEIIHGRVEEKGQLYRLKTGGGYGLGLLVQVGSRTALEHHAQADVVLGRFVRERFRESACADSGRSDSPIKCRREIVGFMAAPFGSGSV